MTDQKTLSPREKQLAELETARRRFSNALRDYEAAGHRYVDRAAMIPTKLVEECNFFGNRNDIIRALPKGGVVGEVGTDRGNFARYIIENAQPKKMEIFEIDVSRINSENLAEHIESGLCVVHEGKSAELLGTMPDNYFDWLYIDGDHEYDGVMLDCEAALSKIKPGGYLVFNDYNVWSVTSMRRCGVARAVNEIMLREKWPMRYFAFQSSMYCDVALQRPS